MIKQEEKDSQDNDYDTSDLFSTSSEEQDSIFDDAEEETQVLGTPKHVKASVSSVNEDYSGKKVQKIKKGEDKCEVTMSVTHKPHFIYNKKNDKFVGEK